MNGSHGSGLQPRALSSGSGQHVHDLVALGLVKLGHEVFYQIARDRTVLPPAGICFVSDKLPAVDIVHGVDPLLVADDMPNHGPRVVSCHSGKAYYDPGYAACNRRWIFVSRTQAESYASKRFVRNGVDPSAHIYAETKADYILFMASMSNFEEKGLHTALELSRKLQVELVVAGSSGRAEIIQRVAALCVAYGAEYVGDVRGRKKAELLANAQALIFPTEWDECCPLVIAESLISGTPVISSNNAACAEMLTCEVGFVCACEQDYINALSNLGSISTSACRDYALEKFHYVRMAQDYVREYEAEIIA